ncbi:exodeoxyribonuclease VII large subunit [uncultured Tyzzerella sp.]|uniref:exodeoxyribonuclease VII large subunit n=1 Tax=uncultured Tyzzerella sp. TaxID=2321398 RepID=UPI002941FB09|nr:exodeoxyribonuclease VII large subunit [uncultured Tyzzerella sp.]
MSDNIYTVSQVNNYIKLVLEDDVLLNGIYIEGEISNLKKHTSGHIYFTIKDEECSINAVMYRQDALSFKDEFENGIKVICFGYISSYTKTGQYQLYVKNVKVSGLGDVFLDFENLKEKLKKEGLFDEVYKMEIPPLPKTIGVITSQTGAAIRDILNVSKRRNPNIKIMLIPALVQGKDAPASIINAINLANEYNNLDIIILARGGGSKEDLWAFNNEDLARAIFYSSIPIVTGIGHEIDFTIADFVADFRAPTPSAAIEVCLPKADDLQEKVYNLFCSINKNINKRINENKLKFQVNINKACFVNFLDKITDYQIFIENKLEKINSNIDLKIKENKLILESNINKIEALSPMNILKNGYALVSKGDNNIKSVKQLKKDDEITLSFCDGDKKAKVIE